MKHCHSCVMPLQGEAGKDYHGIYCNYCSDENGKLYPREIVKKGLVDWFKQWVPEQSEDVLSKRADSYLKAMPAWAE